MRMFEHGPTAVQVLTQTTYGDKFSLHPGDAMQAREQIRSISYLESHTAHIWEKVAATGAPVIIM
jgi:hypothetical protein